MVLKIIKAKDARRVPVIEIDLQSVVPDGMSRRAVSLGLNMGSAGELRNAGVACGFSFFRRHRFVAALLSSAASSFAHRAGALFPEIREFVVAGMAVGPSDVDAGPRRHVHLYTGRFFFHRVVSASDGYLTGRLIRASRPCSSSMRRSARFPMACE